MRVKLLNDDKRFELKKGEVFSAERYRYDPNKITLLQREGDGFEPECNQYKEDCAFWMQDQWHVIKNNK